jgi:hypothetical protein
MPDGGKDRHSDEPAARRMRDAPGQLAGCRFATSAADARLGEEASSGATMHTKFLGQPVEAPEAEAFDGQNLEPTEPRGLAIALQG